jgi:hypothetical protein
MTQPSDRRYSGGPYPDADTDAIPGEPLEEAPRRRGRPRITPLRVFLGIALAASSLVVGYGLLARDATQIPVLTAGEFISGIVFVMLALAGAWAAFSRARDGESGRALVYALLGGVSALLAAGSIAAAIILTLTLDK